MTGAQTITLVILGAALALMLSERLRADLVALLVVFALVASGVLAPQEAFSGFSGSAVITIAAIFIIADALRRTGVTDQTGRLLLRIAGRGETRLVVTVMLAGAFLSLFMNNIAAAAILLPAASGAARRARVSPSRILLPLAFGTILGGMATLLTTTNIIVSGLLRSRGIEGFGPLDFAPVGIPLVVVGILYVALIGRRLLPRRAPSDAPRRARAGERDLVELYRLGERLFRARVPAGSYMCDRPLSESTLREKYGLSALAIEREGVVMHDPAPETPVRAGDVLLLEGDLQEFLRRDIEPHLEILPRRKWNVRDLASSGVVVAETMLSPRSSLIGQTLTESRFREKYGMTVLAIWRAGGQIETDLGDVRLQFGDALLLQGPAQRVEVVRSEPDLILLSHGRGEKPRKVFGRGWVALCILIVTLMIAASWPDLVGPVMLGGALAMVLTRAISMDQAYMAIEWRSIFLVGGMFSAGVAMIRSGTASMLAETITAWLGPAGPLALLAGLFLIAALLSQAMHGAAVAAIIAPLAIETALGNGIPPRSLAMGVALATSMTFLTPLGHPVNILIMGPGGYRVREFVKVGLPLVILLFAAVLLLLPLYWPLAGPPFHP